MRHRDRVSSEAVRRRRRTALALFTLAALLLCMSGQAMAAKFSIPTPEMVAATPTAETVGLASDGANGVWFDDAEDSGPEAGTVYMAHYVPGVPGLTRVNVHELPEGENGQIFGVAPGQNGDEWFTRPFRGTVARISSDGTVTDFPLGGRASPESVVVDSSGNVWISIRGSDTGEHLDRLTPGGELSEWGSGGGDPLGLTVGPDGNLCSAGFTGGVSEISSKVKGQGTVYPLTFAAGDEYAADVASLDGKVWATIGGNAPRIESISPSGAIHNYKLSGLQPASITAGPDGAVWFSGYINGSNTAFVGRLSTSGHLSTLRLGAGVSPEEIAASPTAIYFTQNGTQSGLARIPLTQAAPPGEYVALGDSYSAGEGNPPYEAGTDDEGIPDLCHRSNAAYGPLLHNELGLMPMTFKACSGAVTNDIFDPSGEFPTEPAQRSWLTGSVDLITLTIGGNDAGFPHVLKECVFLLPDSHCAGKSALEAETQARLAALDGGAYATTPSPLSAPIHSILSVIEALHDRANAARIFVGEYPLLFGKQKHQYSVPAVAPGTLACEVGPELWVSYQDAQWLNTRARQLNKIIVKAVKMAKRRGISVTVVAATRFSGHGFCDESELWFHGVSLEVKNLETQGEVGPSAESFHPTATGQQLGYEAEFAREIG
jgi:streptogramin lyase/lysophospholipase L1-like esterase